MDQSTVKNQAGRYFQFLSAVLVGLMICLGVAMLLLVLSPHFAKQFKAPIGSFPCENLIDSSKLESNKEKSTSEQCYKAEDVFALNKAMNISDTLSMFGLLLVLFTFIAPILSFFALKKEKEQLEFLIKENETISRKKIDKLKKALFFLQKKSESSIISSIEQYPKILSSIEAFKLLYQIDKPRGEAGCTTEAHDIALKLTSLLDSRVSAQGVFDHIDSYIKQDAVLENKPHILALKKVLRQLYDATYFGSEERKKALLEFIKGPLNTLPEEFLKN